MGERIAVLGAGPMGLAVAYQLANDGHQPVVFEADDRVGGMAAHFDFSGLSIERFYHFHCTSDEGLFKILEELGLSEKLKWVETKMGYWYQGKAQPWGDPLALLRFKGLGLWAKFRYGLHAFLATKKNNWSDLDRIDAATWLRKGVGDEAYEVLWRRLFEYKFYDLSDNLSAAWIWSRIRRIGRSRYSLFRAKTGYIEGGSEILLEAMKANIEANGGQIRLGSPASKVILEDKRVIGVEVNGEVELFDKVISTIPLPYVPRVIPDLSDDILAKLQSVKNVAVVCVIAKLRKRVTENFWLNINDPEMDIPGLVEYSNLYPMDEHVVYVPYYMPGDNPKFSEPDEVFLEKVKSYLKKINPELSDSDFLDIRASRYRYAQPVCEPRFLEKLPPVQLPVKGLWVADTSYYYPDDRGISESVNFGRQMAKDAVR
jgi:protoporphyrinogen oxidase